MQMGILRLHLEHNVARNTAYGQINLRREGFSFYYQSGRVPMSADSATSPQRAEELIRRRREIDGETELIMRKSIKRRGYVGFIRPGGELAPAEERRAESADLPARPMSCRRAGGRSHCARRSSDQQLFRDIVKTTKSPE